MKTIVLLLFVLDTVELGTGTVFYAKTGQRVILDCGVNSFTQSVTWRHGDDLIISIKKRSNFPVKEMGQIDLTSRSRIRLETQLEISRVKEDDAGRFSCSVDGHSHEHTLVVVSVSVTPSDKLKLNSVATLHCEVKGLNAGSTVQWKSPVGLIHNQKFDIKSVASSDAGTWACIVTQDGITYNETLNIQIKEPETTTSSPTKSSKSDHKTTCTACGTNSKSGINQLSWWVWVAIGVSCLVMVLLIVCVIVLCKQIRRRKKNILRMKNGRLGPKQYCQCNRSTAAARPQQGRRKEKPSALPLQARLME